VKNGLDITMNNEKTSQTNKEEQMYDLGRQARVANYPTSACNLHNKHPQKCWWLAGWHDQDFELGIRVYHD